MQYLLPMGSPFAYRSKPRQCACGATQLSVEPTRRVVGNVLSRARSDAVASDSQRIYLLFLVVLLLVVRPAGQLGAGGSEFAAALIHIHEDHCVSQSSQVGHVHRAVAPDSRDVVPVYAPSSGGPSPRMNVIFEADLVDGDSPLTTAFVQRVAQIGRVVDGFCTQHGIM